MTIFRRPQALRPPGPGMPPRPQEHRETRSYDDMPEHARRVMGGGTRPEFDPCGTGPIQIRKST